MPSIGASITTTEMACGWSTSTINAKLQRNQALNFQNPSKSENEKQATEPFKHHLKLSWNLWESLMSDMQLSKNEVDQLILVHFR